MLLPVNINIILKLFFIYYNSVVLFSHKKSVQLSSYIYFLLIQEKFFFTAKTIQCELFTYSRVMFAFHLYISSGADKDYIVQISGKDLSLSVVPKTYSLECTI